MIGQPKLANNVMMQICRAVLGNGDRSFAVVGNKKNFLILFEKEFFSDCIVTYVDMSS